MITLLRPVRTKGFRALHIARLERPAPMQTSGWRPEYFCVSETRRSPQRGARFDPTMGSPAEPQRLAARSSRTERTSSKPMKLAHRGPAAFLSAERPLGLRRVGTPWRAGAETPHVGAEIASACGRDRAKLSPDDLHINGGVR
ncbi:hypothetical protein AAFF_G00141740 [Aldrovandia affinis]|uniref:Uncharacterized protein n=1 Tax=Aldrovandia affinis TaxID=143900 RepID=A0AAD7TCM4_9TELE|nr:hypothetical protein AAFF_G00141740 [Aldrovandia affinis]